MSTFLPTDSNDHIIPVLRLKPSGAHAISATTGSSAKNSTAFASDTKVVSIYAAEDMYIKFGDASVTATSSDHFFPAGVYYDFAIGGEHVVHTPYMAALAVSTNGAIYISERA